MFGDWSGWQWAVVRFIGMVVGSVLLLAFSTVVLGVLEDRLRAWLVRRPEGRWYRKIAWQACRGAARAFLGLVWVWEKLWLLARLPVEPWVPWLARSAEATGWWGVDEVKALFVRKPRRIYGLTAYVGLYGAGKTISMVEQLERYRAEFGDQVRIYTNFGYARETGPIEGWRQMVRALTSEDKTPRIFALDELAITFSQRESIADGKRIPREIVNLLAQQRKAQVKVLVTVQRFGMSEITFRSLAEYIVECRGFLGSRLIWQRAYKGAENYEPGHDAPGEPRRMVAWSRWFVATDRLRRQYDTLFIAKRLLEYGEQDPEGLEAELLERDKESTELAAAGLRSIGDRRDRRRFQEAVSGGGSNGRWQRR